MPPKEFAEKMREIINNNIGDAEAVREFSNDIMCDVLVELGYGEGIDIYKNKKD